MPLPAEAVLFYEREYYCLSNYSAFRVLLHRVDFDTAEAAYQWLKFPHRPDIQAQIIAARSAHEAAEIGRANKEFRRADWDAVKLEFMREVLTAKASQHEIVRAKLRESGNRPLIENSLIDFFWGSGENGEGRNEMGKLWEEVRDLLP